ALSLAVASTANPGITVAPLAGDVIATSSGVPPPPPPVSAAPFGVPRPVGPSQPAAALQSSEPHAPLEPVVTSKNAPGLAATSAGVALPWPVAAKIAATIGDAALVPPTIDQPPPRAL